MDLDQALQVLDYGRLVDALDEAHRAPPANRQDLLMPGPEPADNAFFLIRAAWQDHAALGVKLVTIMPKNVAAGRPSIHAIYLLFDAGTGRPVSGIDGDALTWFKTACDSALGARYLAPPAPTTLVMVGAGTMASHLVRAHRTVRPSIERVLVWNRTVSRAEQLAADLCDAGLDATAVTELAEAVPQADILCCATMSETPIIRGEWLEPGTHVDLVGSFNATTREVDDAAISAGPIFVDCYGTTLEDVGELAIPLARGVITRDDVRADFYELCAGSHPGRQSAQEITLFKNGGGGHLDLMTAQHITRQLEERAD